MAVKKTILLTSALTALSIAASTVTAHAGGFAVREQSIYGLGSAFAGIAAPGRSPSSMFWNPAAVTNNHGGIVTESNLSFIIPRAELDVLSATAPAFTNIPGVGAVPLAAPNAANLGVVGPAVSASAGAPAVFNAQNLGTAGTGDIALDALVPSSYASVNLGYFGLSDRISVGLSTGAPFGLVTKNDYNSAARYHGRTSELRIINATPTVGFEINDMVSVGVGLQVSYADVRLTQASVVPAISPLTGLPVTGIGGGVVGLQADSEFAGDDIAFGFTAGVTFTPTETTTIGLGFRSAVDHTLDGSAKITGPSPALARDLGGIEAGVTLPETFTFGYRQQLTERFTMLVGAEYTNWSRFEELRVEFDNPALPDNVTAQNYEDGWFVSLGAEFAANEALTLRTGLAYEKSPVQDEFRTPRLPDTDRIWASVGATYALNDRFEFDAAYTHIFAEKGSINLSLAKEPGRGALRAEADSSVDIFGVALRMKLGHHEEPVVDTYYK